LKKGDTIIIPTGIRCKMNQDLVLQIYPRSSLGFKYQLTLDNTVGIIDSDYYYALNEGHIMIKITNHSIQNKTLELEHGKAFAQGVFVKFYKTINDEAKLTRSGGMGSTNL
jgi:dUTP pyrophosphatase